MMGKTSKTAGDTQEMASASAEPDEMEPDAPLGPQRTIVSISNPVWANDEGTVVEAIVHFAELGQPFPFSTDANAETEWGQEIWGRIQAGEFGAIGAYQPQPEPVPASISDRQFFQALAVAGKITKEEALAAVKTGEIPEAMSSLVGSMPPAQRFAAEMLLSGATEFRRDHPLVETFGAANDMTPADVDEFFRTAAQL